MNEPASETPVLLVGRDDELARLEQLVDQAVRYQTAQSVLIVGAQGIGKSELVDRWIAHTRRNHPTIRILVSRGKQGDSAYGCVRRLLQRRFGLGPDLGTDRLRQVVEEVVQDQSPLTEFLHFLGYFVHVSVPDNPFLRALQDDPEQYDQIARTILRRFLEMDALRSPMLLVFEDLQHADERSLSLFHELADTLGGAPLVIAGSCRPTLVADRRELSRFEGDHTQLYLGPLSEADSLELLAQLVRIDTVPQELARVAVEIPAGNPGFLTRLVRLLIDDDVIRYDARGRGEVDVDRVAEAELPLSFEDAIEARIEALSPTECALLEQAAVVGTVFWLGAVVCLGRDARQDSDALPWQEDAAERERVGALLDSLVFRDYLFRLPDASIEGETEYAFKHNMERVLIQRRTPPDAQRRFHRVVAQWIETRLRERTEDQLELLGRHYEAGGNSDRAAFCFLHAGDRARGRFANTQAITFYRRGLELLDNANSLTRIEGLENLGDVHELLGRNEEALCCFDEMLRVAWQIDHRDKGAAAHRKIGRLRREQGGYDAAVEHLSSALELFRDVDSKAGVAETLDALGEVHRLKGAYPLALELHEEALQIKRASGDGRGVAMSLNRIGSVHQDSGAVKDAKQYFNDALDANKALGDRLGVVDSLIQLGGALRAQSDYASAFELWTNGLHLARELGDRLSETGLMIKISEALIQLGRLSEAEQHLKDAASLSTNLGNRRLEAECKRTVAEVYLTLGQLDAAQAAADEALQTVTELELVPQRGSTLLLSAQIAAADAGQEKREQASQLFDEAISIFEGLGNQLEIVRGLSGLADFHDRCGREKEADLCRRRADELLGSS